MTKKEAMGDFMMELSGLNARAARALIRNDNKSRDELMCCVRAMSAMLSSGVEFVHSDEVLKVAKGNLEREVAITLFRLSAEFDDIRNNQQEHYNRKETRSLVKRIYDN